MIPAGVCTAPDGTSRMYVDSRGGGRRAFMLVCGWMVASVWARG
ncbi:MAG: hypothetical protein ACLR23_14660 [Clostridia bacterium]